jgi:hypothetical protein
LRPDLRRRHADRSGQLHVRRQALLTPDARRLTLLALGTYALARIVSLDLLLVAVRELRSARMLAGSRFQLWHNVLSRWDVSFYEGIARAGYPTPLPVDGHGVVAVNAWAFFPLFPILAGAIGRATGLPFAAAAVGLNLLAGAAAAVALAHLVRTHASGTAAIRAVALWAFFPTAFVLQVPYAEALYLALATGTLLALVRRRYPAASLLLLATALTRGYVLPLSAAAIAVLARDSLRRRDDASARPVHAHAAWALLASAAIAPFLWMGAAAIVTGRLDAYAATQRAWGFSLDVQAAPRLWLDAFAYYGAGLCLTPPVLVLAACATLTVIGLRQPMPPELKVYTIAAVGFLLMLAQPGAVAWGSTPRFAFGIVTLPIVLALWLRRGWTVAVVLAAFTALQYVWILDIWSGRLGVAP